MDLSVYIHTVYTHTVHFTVEASQDHTLENYFSQCSNLVLLPGIFLTWEHSVLWHVLYLHYHGNVNGIPLALHTICSGSSNRSPTVFGISLCLSHTQHFPRKETFGSLWQYHFQTRLNVFCWQKYVCLVYVAELQRRELSQWDFSDMQQAGMWSHRHRFPTCYLYTMTHSHHGNEGKICIQGK